MREGLEKDRVRKIYDQLASKYDFMHGTLTFKSDQRGRRLVVEKTIKSGDRVLDAGGGTGSTAILAAQRVGETGKVIVLDLSQSMLDLARKRFVEAGLESRAEFVEGDLLALPFADATFDAVVSTYSLCPVADPINGVLEMLRVLRKGGQLGMAYSIIPENPVTKKIATFIENTVWRFPSISMGCRAISVLDRLNPSVATVKLRAEIGVPLWPFEVVVLQKP